MSKMYRNKAVEKRGWIHVEDKKPPYGYVWRRQGTGWTLLRSRYEMQPDGSRKRLREYVQHYSATALRAAETLRERKLV